MEGNNIISQAEDILEHKALERECAYVHDPQYQDLTGRYLNAVEQRDWKTAHDLLVALNILKERLAGSC